MARKPKKTREQVWWEQYRDYLDSEAWADFRLRVIHASGHKCLRCGKRCPSYRLHVHHKHYRTLGHETPADVEVLCIPCHEKHHGRPLAMGWEDESPEPPKPRLHTVDPYRPYQKILDRVNKCYGNVPKGRPW